MSFIGKNNESFIGKNNEYQKHFNKKVSRDLLNKKVNRDLLKMQVKRKSIQELLNYSTMHLSNRIIEKMNNEKIKIHSPWIQSEHILEHTRQKTVTPALRQVL